MIPNLLSRLLPCILVFTQIVEPACVNNVSLGLQSFKITDRQINRSGTIYKNYGASEVRLSGKGWCAINESHPHLIVDFLKVVTISKIATQGVDLNGTSIFTSKFRLQFGYMGSDWYDYKTKDGQMQIIGNNDSATVVNNTIDDTMARFVKVLPLFDAGQNVTCLKMEIYGCKSYQMPNVETNSSSLTLKNKQTGSIQCNVAGQIGLNARWTMQPQDTMAVDALYSNSTRGVFYNETRLLSFKQPDSLPKKPYGASCSLERKEGVVICKENYTCKADYSFAKDKFNEQTIAVVFKKDVSIELTVNEGQLSALVVKALNVSCSATSQDPVSIEWYHKEYSSWASSLLASGSARKGHLYYVTELVLSTEPKPADIVEKLNCSKHYGYESAILCATTFICKAYYPWNSSIKAEHKLPVYFPVTVPSRPDSLEAECGSRECAITWAQSKRGDLPKASIRYVVIVKDQSKIISQETVNDLSFAAKNLSPNHQYTAVIQAQIKDGGGNTWLSEAAKESFTTRPVAPISKVAFLPITVTNDSLTFKWKPLVLPQESGKLLKYDYQLKQVKCGNLKELCENQNWQGNIDSSATMFQHKRLKPWRTYEFVIVPINVHFQKGSESMIKGETAEYVPSRPPYEIKADVQATESLIEWRQPSYAYWNGLITHYHIKWKRINWSQRSRRDIEVYQNLLGTVREFKCERSRDVCSSTFKGLVPYQKYIFKIAAKTKEGLGPFSGDREFLTLQAAPSAPTSLSYNETSPTFYLTWREPLERNGILIEYEIEMEVDSKIKADFTQNTFYDTRINSPRTLKFRVRGYTEHLHNIGGHAGEWAAWTVAKRLIKEPKQPGQDKTFNTALAIGLSFGFVVLILIAAIITLFFLYRRRERGGARKKLEVEMDSIVEDDSGESVPEEQTPLTLNHDGHDIYDKPVESHNAVPIDQFQSYVGRMREDNDELFEQQFKELLTGKCYSTEIGLSPANKPKNRYVNVAAYDHSRVILKPEGGKRIIHHRESDYFNANHIEGYCPQSTSKYIASQGPMESVFVDFWRMIWQENISVIIMLTNREEGGKVKCDQYWPSQGACKYGHITVRFNRVDQTADYFIRTFDVEKGTGRDKIKRALIQFHFISWPDYGVPEFPTAILSLRRRVRHYYDGNVPILVHCSAGIGRTGCFILIDAMLEGVDNGESRIDIFNYLQYMRTRRINMVQTMDQYIFAHLSILEYLTFGDTEISAVDFERKFKDLQRENGIEKEFELIESTSPDLESIDNSSKVLLKAGRFIDVFYVDGYKQRDAFFICNSPSVNMTPDFWKMVIEQNCHTVVMLNRLEEEGNHKYWPDLSTHYSYENYSVVMISEQVNGNIFTRKFKITSSESPEEHFELNHFQFLDWPSDGIPRNKDSILTLMSLIEKSRQNYGNGPVLVHSGNGAGRSGTLIAIYNSTERLKVEQLIDIPQCVRAIRTIVPIAIGVKGQYEFIYEMIRTYLEAFETYSNFSDPTMAGIEYR